MSPAILAACAKTVTKTVTVGSDTTAAPEPPPPPPPAPPANPKGSTSTTCAYLLGDSTQSVTGYRFVADTTVKNTGNVGIVARLTATWDQIGGAPVVVVKTVRVPFGRSQLVHFLRVASSDEIDRHQAADGGCHVRAAIIDSFGATH